MDVHRFFVFVEHGLLPIVVDSFFKEISGYGCRVVVDPFVGGGVVAVEGVKRGFHVIGVDSNPWALIVSTAKTTPIRDLGLSSLFKEAIEFVKQPLIPSPRLRRYHSEGVLARLGVIRAAIEFFDKPYKPLLLTILGRVVEEYSL